MTQVNPVEWGLLVLQTVLVANMVAGQYNLNRILKGHVMSAVDDKLGAISAQIAAARGRILAKIDELSAEVAAGGVSPEALDALQAEADALGAVVPAADVVDAGDGGPDPVPATDAPVA